MGKETQLHEILAVEQHLDKATNKLLTETIHKFNKPEYFQGHEKTLKMHEESDANTAIQDSEKEIKLLPTTVHETLDYLFSVWNNSENVKFQKSLTNQVATADLMYNGNVLVTSVPVDELLGLEKRLETIRNMLNEMPTLSASIAWEKDSMSGRLGSWKATHAEYTTKTENTTTPVVLYEATEHHPAQVKEVPVNKVVGKKQMIKFSGAATSAQKAEVISIVDNLINEVKQARMRANTQLINNRKIAETLTDVIMSPFRV